jgi:ATP synthase protein I
MSEENHELPSLEALNRKIAQAKPKAGNADHEEPISDYSQAFRFTADLIGGVLVGGAIGYGIDSLADTLPWAMIVCIFLGTAAGIRNMMKSAKEIERQRSE